MRNLYALQGHVHCNLTAGLQIHAYSSELLYIGL